MRGGQYPPGPTVVLLVVVLVVAGVHALVGILLVILVVLVAAVLEVPQEAALRRRLGPVHLVVVPRYTKYEVAAS